MIKLKATFNDGLFIPERGLEPQELSTVTSILTHGGEMTITYFQGDEPKDNNVYTEEPENKVDLKSILESATPEEIAFIKQLLK